MDYFWKENKKFLIAVGGALLLALLYDLFVLSPLGEAAEGAARSRETERRALEERMRAGVPTEETLALARRERDRTLKMIGDLVGDAGFAEDERFRPPGSERPKTHFDSLKLDLTGELRERAVKARVDIPQNWGLDEDFPEEEAEEYLLRLAAAYRLALLAIESQVEKVELLDARHDATYRGGGAMRKGVFLSRASALMKFRGSSEAVFRVLHGAQQKGRYLAVTQFEAVREDPTKDLISVSLGASVLRVDPAAPIEPGRAGR